MMQISRKKDALSFDELFQKCLQSRFKEYEIVLFIHEIIKLPKLIKFLARIVSE